MNDDLRALQHDHSFSQDRRRPGEMRTRIVIVITLVTMAVEITAGLRYGSMALLADGLHMASHAAALGISAFAYAYARRHAHNRRYSFGTGKVNALGGFSGAILLAVFALYMAIESLQRLIDPVTIAFNQAIFVAVLGLLVNGASVLILGVDDHHHGDDGHHGHEHEHHHHHDHNLTSAYFHVLADALTSLLAIVALICAKYFGAIWMDPVIGVLGALLVARWSYGLLKTTATVLLDEQALPELQSDVTAAIESDGVSRVSDLHLWSIGPGIYSLQVAIVTQGGLGPSDFRARFPFCAELVHVNIEVNPTSALDTRQ